MSEYIPENFNRAEIIRHVLNNRLNVVTGRLELALDCNTINNIKEQISIALTACRGLADAIVEVSKEEKATTTKVIVDVYVDGDIDDEIEVNMPIKELKQKTLFERNLSVCDGCKRLTADELNESGMCVGCR
jgi:hypothetical protein